ncbi:ArdC-like ssDNA-binding domain-containing protein [Mesorhizobium sp. A556]
MPNLRRGAGTARHSPRLSALGPAPPSLEFGFRTRSAPRRPLSASRPPLKGARIEGCRPCRKTRPLNAAIFTRKSPKQLIAAIEANPGQPSLPWRKNGGGLHIPTNALNGNAYDGINVVSLWVAGKVLCYGFRITAPNQCPLLGDPHHSSNDRNEGAKQTSSKGGRAPSG